MNPELDLMQSGLGLALVLGLLLVIAWALRRLRPGRRTPPLALSLKGQLSVGPKEKVVVVDIEGDWLVLGVAPGRVSLLALGGPEPRPDTQGGGLHAAEDDERPLGPLDTIERSAAFRQAFGIAKTRCRGARAAAAPQT